MERMKVVLEDAYYLAKEVRGMSEVLFLATISPDSIATHTDDALRVLLQKCNQLVEELEKIMNADETEEEIGIKELFEKCNGKRID